MRAHATIRRDSLNFELHLVISISYKVFKGLHHDDWLDYHFKELKVTEIKGAREEIIYPQLY